MLAPCCHTTRGKFIYSGAQIIHRDKVMHFS